MTTTGQTSAPGWYPDPSDARQLRWFDGQQWTASTHLAQPPAAPPTYQAPTYTPPQYGQSQFGQAQFGQAQFGQAQFGQAQFGQAVPAQQPAAQQQQMPANGCQLCGAGPAMKVHLRGHQGMLFMMRWLTYRGQYCRDCGTARFREVQSKTMLVGWWGYFSFVINTYNVFHNLGQLRGLQALGAPRGRVRAAKPMPPSVFQSPGFYVTLCLPVLLWFLYQRAIGG